ncbi:MAG: hypothetical protein V4689_21255 [Verrucomicrobiota bacterium]
MSKETTDDANRSRRGAFIAVALVLIAFVATDLKVEEKDAGPTGDADFRQIPDPASTREVNLSLPDNRRARGILVPRAAIGKVPAPAAHRSWGLITVEDIVGSPQPGDVAYLARLGPDHGVMKVESVEGNQAILTIDTLDGALIREGDRIETMPPLTPAPHE